MLKKWLKYVPNEWSDNFDMPRTYTNVLKEGGWLNLMDELIMLDEKQNENKINITLPEDLFD